MAAATLSVRPNRLSAGSPFPRPPPVHPPNLSPHLSSLKPAKPDLWRGLAVLPRRTSPGIARAGSRADDSVSFKMSVENALKLLGVSETASFDDMLRAKNSNITNCEDDQDAISPVEAAYDMLLMQSLTQRRARKVVDGSSPYADVNTVNTSGMGSMPRWLQTTLKKSSVSVETLSTEDLGIQAADMEL